MLLTCMFMSFCRKCELGLINTPVVLLISWQPSFELSRHQLGDHEPPGHDEYLPEGKIFTTKIKEKQHTLEALEADVLASYLHFKRHLPLLDKTTENYSDNSKRSLNLWLKSQVPKTVSDQHGIL